MVNFEHVSAGWEDIQWMSWKSFERLMYIQFTSCDQVVVGTEGSIVTS